MKKKNKKSVKKVKVDVEVIKFWKNMSTKDTFQWLEDAIKFANTKKTTVKRP